MNTKICKIGRHEMLANKAKEIWDAHETKYICHCIEYAVEDEDQMWRSYPTEYHNLVAFILTFLSPARSVEGYLYPELWKEKFFSLEMNLACERFRNDTLWPAIFAEARRLDGQPTTPKEI